MSAYLCLEGEMSLSWKPDNDDGAQNTSVKSVDSIPGVQDPLGSSVMTPSVILSSNWYAAFRNCNEFIL